ncbi:4-hydroxy-tetrahydrodipicolinate reductase [Buchnera aphidicola (Brachycaudus cardui)]|uniref:4-hydroxy-tetrahydrodipicolinate reductase n=1 Tax=Buchnera aphidicola (Brachycaudus cardui) TaxID=557993 RepID=A0A4D6XX38_9GAMM|nr:4-hydroxy-tetrahydrodipicolinate reductase [Buchnera aphidicola]QCI20299.1 4-hydroxy-tetrahydrodipicolinate reductase [Buchnera aphidicola (Brachycaudus cardui)]
MNKIKTRIAITGPMGRMGQILIKEIQKNKNTCLTLALLKKHHPLINKDIGESLGIGKIGIIATDKLNHKKNKDFDVLIDFTNPSTTLHYLKYCSELKKNIVIGTTGFSEEEIHTIKIHSKEIGIIISSNFSIGINLLFQLVEKSTEIIGKNSDINIMESHHRNKIDAPSGTALSIGKVISKVMNWDLQKHSIYYTPGITGIRKTKKIGFSVVRSGDIVGKHTVMFSSSGEEIKITHTASNRICFAKGAIQSAIWLHKKKMGLFDMTDVLSST